MTKYRIIKIDSSDGITLENQGSKRKYWLPKMKALIKLNGYYEEKEKNYVDWSKEIRSWNVSEKIFSEIAHHLGFMCVKTDFVVDEKGIYGIASYDFRKDGELYISGDDLYIASPISLPKKTEKRSIDANYHYEDIVKMLLFYSNNLKLITDFNKIIIMDALTGESDRHYENWGIRFSNNEYTLLPMYDNSSCLLNKFREEAVMKSILDETSIEDYAKRSKSKIKINNKKVRHYDFIKQLLISLPPFPKFILIEDIKKLENLSDVVIENIVNKVPEKLCSDRHKELIIEYIKIRKRHLLSLVEGL